MSQAGVPQQIGPYPVERLLARGGMGAVYLGRHPQLGYEVAIKVLLAGRDATGEQRSRFRREVAALSKLHHPNLVKVFEAGDAGDLPWFAMRRVEGESLAECIGHEGPLPLEEVVELGLQLSSALSVAHAAGILHRDLKPENVIRTPSRLFVVTDFGLAKNLEAEPSVDLTRTGRLQGTPGYWSPEQASGGGRGATTATDVYGLGATLYAALTGEPPVSGDDLIQMLVATREKRPPRPSALRPEVPRWLERVVLRCLEKDPGDRYPSMEALRAHLQAREAARLPGSRRVALPVLLAAAALGGLSGAAWFLTAGQDSAPEPPEVSKTEGPANERASPAPPQEPTPPAVRAPDSAGAEEESPAHLTNRALALFEAGDPTQAAGLLLRAAELGDPNAMFSLGVLLQSGQGIERNAPEAARWYREAAELGNPMAMNNLAHMLTLGLGMQRNEAEAVRWYRRAAELGEPLAMNNLGRMLLEGVGARQDVRQAARLFHQAAELGDPQGMTNLAHALSRGDGIAQDPAQAARWYRKAAEQGYLDAMTSFGFALANGVGVEQDTVAAVRWYRRAADQGDPAAMHNLGLMFEGGLGVQRDALEAARWQRRAARQPGADPRVLRGASEALRRLGEEP